MPYVRPNLVGSETALQMGEYLKDAQSHIDTIRLGVDVKRIMTAWAEQLAVYSTHYVANAEATKNPFIHNRFSVRRAQDNTSVVVGMLTKAVADMTAFIDEGIVTAELSSSELLTKLRNTLVSVKDGVNNEARNTRSPSGERLHSWRNYLFSFVKQLDEYIANMKDGQHPAMPTAKLGHEIELQPVEDLQQKLKPMSSFQRI